MLSSESFVVRKERGRKVVSLVEPDRPERSSEKKNKNQSAGLMRKLEIARTVVRYFKPYADRKTMSVFGAKDLTKDEMRLVSLVAKKVFDFKLYFMGVAEIADSGPHAHFIAFKEVDNQPWPLTPAEEKTLCSSLIQYISAWRSRANKNLRPSRFLLRKLKPSQENTTSRLFYRVPKIVDAKGKKITSGYGSLALSYSLKSMLVPSKKQMFCSSVGLTEVISLVRSKQEVRVKSRSLWTKDHSTYRFSLLSIVAFEAEKQLRYREPKNVCVYIKYGRVFVETDGGKLKLYRNVYLLVGLELLRRDLCDFSATSILRRHVSKVCKALCPQLKQLDTEVLNRIAREQRDAICWAAERKLAHANKRAAA
jgi:hypothetical protein